ncbi:MULTISPECIES: VOC family protein [Bacillus]|uniref:VOC family protein n=1 Tax=Bacillus TaxID=1386 RepID=UPI000BB8E986|nr:MULTISPECIES: VOC family protein [Bacillus]
MINSIYETHLEVLNINEAILFYEKLGLKVALKLEERKAAFLYVGKDKQMLGLWEVPAGKKVSQRHFAFGVELDFLKQSLHWLKDRNIEPIQAFGKEPTEPIVHTWMAAASVYFEDIDGNELEFISLLDGEPESKTRIIYLSEWMPYSK